MQRYCAYQCPGILGTFLGEFLRESLLTVPSVASDHLGGGSTGSSIWTQKGTLGFIPNVREKKNLCAFGLEVIGFADQGRQQSF